MNRELRIVREIIIAEGITIITTRGVRRLRNCNAFEERCRCWRYSELGDHPTLRRSVKIDDWIAVIGGLALAAKTSPERVGCNWAQNERAGCLAVDSE